MCSTIPALEFKEYRVALIHPTSRAVLIVDHGNDGPRLPRVQIPTRARVTQDLHKALETKWNIRGIVLGYLKPEEDSSACAVLALLSPEVSNGLRPVDLHATSDFSERERTSLLSLLDEESTTFLSRTGWLYEAVDWVGRTTGERVRSILEIEQLNAGSQFALLRLPMRSGRSY